MGSCPDTPVSCMNYLAHVFLQRSSPDLLIGGLLGDFVKGTLDARFSPTVQEGILLHRAIDRYTDGHPTVRASTTLISPLRRRFAGILIDVFYDHFLTRHWHRYSEQTLEAFTHQAYKILASRSPSYPERLQRILPIMTEQDWLASYMHIESVDTALHGIARRFQRYPRAAVLGDSVQELIENYDALERQFLDFFPDLIAFVNRTSYSPAEVTMTPLRAARR